MLKVRMATIKLVGNESEGDDKKMLSGGNSNGQYFNHTTNQQQAYYNHLSAKMGLSTTTSTANPYDSGMIR